MTEDKENQNMNRDQSLFDFFPAKTVEPEDQAASDEYSLASPGFPAAENMDFISAEDAMSENQPEAVPAAQAKPIPESPKTTENILRQRQQEFPRIETPAAPIKHNAPASDANSDGIQEKTKKGKIFGKNKNKPAEIQISCGKYLTEARLAAGLSFEEVEEQTKIRKSYLAALENEDLKNLPPPVFICAYIKTLCRIYRVAPENADEMLTQFRQTLPTHLAGETLNNLAIDREIDEDEERKLKMLLIGGIAALALVFIGIVIFAFVSLSGQEPGTRPDQTSVKFSGENMLTLAPDQFIKPKELHFRFRNR